MSLKLILGNSGCGKTEYMYEEAVRLAEANPKKNYLVVVPEQFTMQTQRKLVDLSANQAIMNIDVLSFKRLAYRVFDEQGIGNLEILEETGKNLVLRKIAQEQEDKLSLLRGNMHRMGYISEIKSLISELMQYNISPKQLEELLQERKSASPEAKTSNSGKTAALSPQLQMKLQDVQVIYESFLEFLQGNYITQEELLHVLISVAENSSILKDSLLILDEFTGFTPVQVELLGKLMSICSEIWVSLTIDEKENFYHSKGMQELFDMPKKTIRSLMDLAKKTHTEVLEPKVITGGEKKRFKEAPALYFMEQNLFRKTYQRKHGKIEEIQMFSLKNPKEELVWAARKINELVQKEGYRYRDIAVVSGDVETYGNYVEQVCRKYQIPYFLDTTKEVLFHPFIEFICAILEVISNDFSYHAMMRLLRSGYLDITQQEVDHLENYLLATGIHGKKMWEGKWLRTPKNKKAYDLESLENLREKIMADFAPVVETFAKKSTLEEQIKALDTYITCLQVEQKLFQREKELLEAGEQAKSKEYAQIYGIVMDLFQKCVFILGQEHLSIKEVEEILDSGFEAAQVAVIPPGYDSVTIGDIERTRLNHVKVLIFMGVNEGIVPKAAGHGGIISQYEREALEAADITLAPGAREQVFIQKFYLYLNMTKPSQKLYLTYSRVDSEGKTLRPSYLIRTMQRMFPDMTVKELEELDKVMDISTEAAAKDFFLSEERSPQWYALAKCFLESEDEEVRKNSQAILDACYYRYRHDPISHVVAEAIYGKNIEGSVTRLEKFARCAYSHFLSYGLKLKEREESGFERVDMGNLYHEALEKYSRKLADSQYDWFTIPEEIRDDFAIKSMEEAVLAYPNLSIYATAENAHMADRMNHIFKQTIWALTTQVRKGSFIPKDFEVDFSKADNLTELEYELETGNKVLLKGRIDRLDTCVDENKTYIKVIDYKSGSTKFDLLKLYQGMQLQLVVYMNAAMALEKKENPKKSVIPGGLFYYHIDDPVIEVGDGMSEADIKEAILQELKPEGLVNSQEEIYRAMDDAFETKSQVIPVEIKKNGELSARSSVATTQEFEILRAYVDNTIERIGADIYKGNVEIAPVSEGQNGACSFCPYKAVCGFDIKVEGFEEKRLEKLEKSEIFERMERDNAMAKAKKGK